MGLNSTNDSVKHSEQYEDGYYVGVVTNNQDPLGIGRIQANVPGLFNPSKGPVPWIGPIKDSPYGFGKGAKGPFGVYGAPAVGSQVKVELQKGDEHNALYTPLPTVPSANPAFKDPQTWGFQDPSGNQLLVNMATGVWTFTHSSGDTLSYDSSGNRTTLVKGNSSDTVNGSMNLTVQGSANVNVGGDANVNVSGTGTYTASMHKFNGPVVMSETLNVAADITDSTASGNSQTMSDMRVAYDEHEHEVRGVQGGSDTVTSDKPTPQV